MNRRAFISSGIAAAASAALPAATKGNRIQWLVVADTKENFNGREYSIDALDAIVAAVNRGDVRHVWRSDDLLADRSLPGLHGLVGLALQARRRDGLLEVCVAWFDSAGPIEGFVTINGLGGVSDTAMPLVAYDGREVHYEFRSFSVTEDSAFDCASRIGGRL